MRELVGVTPPDDRLGCLQDIHWPVGGFGYFPCYTLGAMLAAQLFRAAQAQVPGLLDAIGQGDFAPLLAWLRQNVHGQGAMPGSGIWSRAHPARRWRSSRSWRTCGSGIWAKVRRPQLSDGCRRAAGRVCAP